MNSKILAAAALFAGMAGAPAEAATIVDTGAGPNGPGGHSIFRGPRGSNFLAGEFTLASAAVLDKVEGWIYAFDPKPEFFLGNLTISLYADGGDAPLTNPGLALHTANFVAANSPNAAWQGVDINWALAPGTYWVSFEAPGFTSAVMPTTTGAPANPLGNEAFWNGSQWVASDSLNVGVRIFSVDAPVDPIPEPATWAMLIAGFGLIGAAARVRVRQLRLA